MRVYVNRPFDVGIDIEDNSIKGIDDSVFGPNGADAFFLGNMLYVQIEKNIPENTNKLPSIQIIGDDDEYLRNFYDEPKELIRVDGKRYVIQKARERRKKENKLEEAVNQDIGNMITSIAESPDYDDFRDVFNYAIIKIYNVHYSKQHLFGNVKSVELFKNLISDIETILKKNIAPNGCNRRDAEIIIEYFNKLGYDVQSIGVFNEKYVTGFLKGIIGKPKEDKLKLKTRFEEAYNAYLSKTSE